MSQELTMKLPDGRGLSYTAFGNTISPNKPTAFYFHGYPGSCWEGELMHEVASKRGITVVGVTRPGFGGSSSQPRRRLLDFPVDVLALADHLGVQQFAVVGLSGGGPYSLACLYAIPPERVLGTVVMSGMYPASFGLSSMTLENRILMGVGRWSPGLVSLLGRPARTSAQDDERWEKAVAGNVEEYPEVDRKILHADDNKLMKMFARSAREVFKGDLEGFGREAKIFGSSWGFKMEDLKAAPGKLEIWHGTADTEVPIGMADKAVALISNAEYHRCQDEGHVGPYANHTEEIVDSLARMLKC